LVQIAVMDVHRAMNALDRGFLMIAPMTRITFAAFALLTAWPVHAQDVPGIEICTVEKTMERRTSCLQSNVDFLQKTINKLTSDHQQKLDASNRQIEALKNAVIGLQKLVSELQAAQGKAEDAKKAAPPAAPAAKDAAPAKEGAK
jgi:TolA-binding protein